MEQILTHAVVATIDLHVIWWTDAGVVADGVVALTGTADSGTLALIHIWNRARHREEHISLGKALFVTMPSSLWRTGNKSVHLAFSRVKKKKKNERK